MGAAIWRTGTITIDGTATSHSEAGQGDAVLCLQAGADIPRAFELIAAQRRVIVLTLPGVPAVPALLEAIASLGVQQFDLIGVGDRAALALALKSAAADRAGAVVLLGPTALGADGGTANAANQSLINSIGDKAGPCLALFGTRDEIVPLSTARHYRERFPDCNLVFVYDAGHAMAEERPEAVSSITLDFLARRDLFLVRRDSDMIFP